MSLGYSNISRIPLGYQGWHRTNLSIQFDDEPEPLSAGDIFPKCNLSLLKPLKDATYLGIEISSKTVRMIDIPADYIYVEIYNERCSGCVEEIKNYKVLYENFNKNSELSTRIKIIGIGAGSKSRNVARFRKTYEIPFPLFADSNWKLFECLGSPALPTSYLIKRIGDDQRQIVFVQSDHIEDINSLMRRISGMLLKN